MKMLRMINTRLGFTDDRLEAVESGIDRCVCLVDKLHQLILSFQRVLRAHNLSIEMRKMANTQYYLIQQYSTEYDANSAYPLNTFRLIIDHHN